MKRQRGFQADRLRRLLQRGAGRADHAAGRSPHFVVPPPRLSPSIDGAPDDARARLAAILKRWEHFNAPLPEESIRRGLVSIEADRETLGSAVRFDACSYQRTRIYEGRHFEVLVLCWRSGQASPIHDHGGSICGLLVVEGAATEIQFESSPCGRLTPVRSHLLPERTLCVSRGGDVHQVANLQRPGLDLVSLHVYSPPLAAGRCFRLSETIFGDHDAVLHGRSDAATVSIL